MAMTTAGRTDVVAGEEKVVTIKFKKPKAWSKIKEAWDENPMLVITVGTAAVAALGKLIDAAGSIQSKRAYAKRMNKKQEENE
jgi:hypothetical protein